MDWPNVNLTIGQVWVAVETSHVYCITGLNDWSVFYVVVGEELIDGHGPFVTSRIQWELDITNDKLVRGLLPKEVTEGR